MRHGGVLVSAVAVSVLVLDGRMWIIRRHDGRHERPDLPRAEPADSRQPAPAFSGKTMDGVAVSSDGFKGKPTVLAFWASW